MSRADELVAAAMAGVHAHYGYGLRSLNGKPQRGPTTFDCIGYFRHCLLEVAPELWPTSWHGPDSWTVPSYHAAYQKHGLTQSGPSVAPRKGEALIYGPNHHIGTYDGAGGLISALNVARGVCVVPYRSLTDPLTAILHLGLDVAPSPPPPLLYTVVRGDTLSKIARKFGLPSWRLVYDANRAVIGPNPSLIHPGQVLTIPRRPT